ncbi:hypothetical protein MHYP_G00322170 [Metynnis hypsauchen]
MKAGRYQVCAGYNIFPRLYTFTLLLTMELRVTALLLLVVCATIFTTTEGDIPQCCVRVSSNIPCTTLNKVQKYEVQKTSGSCDVAALILHMRGKTYCADPKYDKILKMPKRNERKWIRDCKRMLRKTRQ